MERHAVKEALSAVIEDCRQELWDLSDYIHANPEMAFEEHKAAAALAAFLTRRGFTVQEKAGGLETAFLAEWCPTGHPYPLVDILAEYDALSIGHACGHNVIAAAAAGAAAALHTVMERFSLPGTLRVAGTPAEESGGGKILMQKAGVFDRTDCMLLLHPTSGTTKIAGNCKSSFRLRAVYRGKAAHAGSHPEDGVNAADAAAVCYMAAGCLRNQLPEEVQVMPVILDGGKENGLIPDTACIAFSIRCFRMKYLTDAVEKVKNCIRAGALAAGCTVEIEEIPGYQGRVCSHVLERIVRENFRLLGEPVMDGMVDDNGGEDFGNLNRIIPGVMPYPSLLPEEKISNHTPRFRELAVSPRAREVILLGSKVLAYSAADLFCEPDAVRAAKAELEELQKTF